MILKDIIDIHEEYGAVLKFYLQPAVNGGVLKLPSNIIKMFPEREVIYEVDNNEILVYENKTKTRSLKVDLNYAIISTMIIDIKVACERQGYALDLCKIYNSSNECVNESDVMVDLLKFLIIKENKKDYKLMDAIINFMDNPESIEKIDSSIEEGFNFCYNYYMENIEND